MTLPISFHLRALTRISLQFLKSLQLWVKKLLIQTANECKSNSNCNQMSSSNTCQAKQTQRLWPSLYWGSVIWWATFIFAVKVGDIIATWWEITAWPCCAEESAAVKALAWVLKLTALLTPQLPEWWTKPDTLTEASTITLSLSARAAAQNEAGC